MPVLIENFKSGTLDAGIDDTTTTITSAAFANLAAVSGGDTLKIVLDPEGAAGDPEIAEITSHTASSTSVTVATRGTIEATANRAHGISTKWVAAVTAGDLNRMGFDGSGVMDVVGDVTGNADTATALATSRTISLGGDLSGSAGFDGSANVTITAAVANDSHTHNSHGVGGDLTGTISNATVSQATKLRTPRTIDITGDITATAVAFDGTANIAISAAVNNDSHSHTGATLSAIPASDITAGTFGSGNYVFPGTVNAASGSSTDPGWGFSSDLDTGVYLISTGVLGITTGGGTRLRIDNGAVKAGSDNTESSGTSGFRWTAVWAVNGSIQTSDLREKVELGPSLGLDFIDQLRPFSGRWIADGPDGEVHQWLGAQDVASALASEGISPRTSGMWHQQDTDDDGEPVEFKRQSLAYTEFIPPLIAAVQELKAEVDELKG